MSFRHFLLLAVCVGPLYGQAKQPSTPAVTPTAVTTDCQVGVAEAELVVGDVRAKLYNMGSLFWRDFNDPAYHVPKGSGVNAFYVFGFQMSGLVGTDLRVSANRYGPFQFTPGPLDGAGNAPADCAAFDRIWTVTDQDLQRYDATGIASDNLRDWPANLGAEVIDGDGNPDNYDLAAGDRPRLFGTQTAFWVMNDVGLERSPSQSEPLSIEVQVTAWAIASDDPTFDQATFYRYRVVNRNPTAINDAIVSFFMDGNLGFYWGDDLSGSDSARNLVYIYNAFNEDPNGHGSPTPAMGMRFLDVQAGSATTDYNGGCDDRCDPQSPEEHRYYQTSRWRDGSPLTYGDTGYGGTTPTPFIYPSEPGTYWSMPCFDPDCEYSFNSKLRRLTFSTVAFDLAAGASRDVTFALPFAFGTQNYGPVGNPTGSVQAVKLASDRIQAAFNDGSLFAPAPRPLTLEAPTLLTPADGALFRLDEDESLPTLRWTPVPGAEGYQLTIEIDQGSEVVKRTTYTTEAELVFDEIVPDNTTFTYRWSVEPDGRLPDGTRTAGKRSETRSFSLYRFVPGIAGDNGQGIVEVASASGGDPCAATPDDLGCADGLGGNTVWHDTDAAGDYYVSSGGFNGQLVNVARNQQIVGEDEIELRFTAACAEPGACLAVYYTPASADGAILSVPFEAWHLADTPDNPADDT
ncbi:MAG: hypothetical protein AAF624_19195, partial [Bacteroidota bacterium]